MQAAGNIPAYAGKTGLAGDCASTSKEHPRVCGENKALRVFGTEKHGTSPRMRGKPTRWLADVAKPRNIPAYAGKTAPGGGSLPGGGEHPRVCGENSIVVVAWAGVSGTSPRMRGKQGFGGASMCGAGNIPAYAGKTTPRPQSQSSTSEHPRVCGENLKGFHDGSFLFGTSPRMRGKL